MDTRKGTQSDIASYSTVVIIDTATDEQPCYLAYHPELEGCMSHGATPSEALQNLREVTEIYISVLLEKGLEVPAPRQLEGVWSIVNPLSSESDAHTLVPEVVERPQSADMSPGNLHPGVRFVQVA